MEMLASFFNPSQIGHLRDVTKSVSLEDVAEVATSSFRSMGTTREDSLVFILGLLNLGTVLCYAVYSQLFKPNRRGSSFLDENHFVMKKIQTILDELVLHVHTSTYYRSSLERNQDGASKRDLTFRPRSADSSSIPSLFTIFDLPEPLTYGEKEPPAISQFPSRRSSDDYDTYLQREAKKMIQEWLSFLVQSTPIPFLSRTKRQTMMSFPNRYRLNTTTRHRPWSIRKRIGRPSTLAPSALELTSRPMTKMSTTAEPHPEWTLNQKAMSQLRRPQMKRLVAAATGAEADGRVLAAAQAAVAVARSTSEQDASHPAHLEDVPVLPVYALFPRDTVRPRGIGSSHFKSDRSGSSRSGMKIEQGSTQKPEDKSKAEEVTTAAPKEKSEPRHIPSEFRQQMYSRHPAEQLESPYDQEISASIAEPAEEDNFIVRLMHLIQQTIPLAMDVLDVYKSKAVRQQESSEPKCLERLLCQLNQDWKGKGSVPAAMAPFLSIAMGWLLNRSATPDLSHILMAVRAGWIGKQCANLYPRCANPGRLKWTVTSLHEDSLNLPSIGQLPVKVRPPLDFFAFTPTPSTTHIESTMRPISSLLFPSPQPKAPHSSEPTGLHTRTASTTAIKKNPSSTDWNRESSQGETSNLDYGLWDQHSIEVGEEEQTTSTVIGTSLQVDRNGKPDAASSSGPDNLKPWGKPSRFSGTDADIELSDIVRGVYSTTTEKDYHLYEGEYEEYDEEEEEEEEEEEGEIEKEPIPSTKKPVPNYPEDSILHDLNKYHFTDKTTIETPVMAKDTYEELQKKKTHRLEMVPNRGLVHPWLSEPVWVPENPWQSKTDVNHPRPEDDNEEAGDRYRDRVSFGHEDAVKDVRLFDFAMQYLRDRSA